MKSLTIGKVHGLQCCSDGSGALVLLAIDHRGHLRRLLDAEDPDRVSADALSGFKQDVVRAVGNEAAAILTDPQYGAAQMIARGALPSGPGLIVALETTGFSGTRQDRASRILADWSVAKAARMGADAVRLLVYYHPEADGAPAIESLVDSVAHECQAADLPLFLAALPYSIEPDHPSLAGAKRIQAVTETARILTSIPGVDIYMSEFPADIIADQDQTGWEDACARLSVASRVPWVLLSAAVEFDTFLRLTEIACRQGASGCAAGRAAWQEAVSIPVEKRSAFLQKTCRSRISQLAMICASTAVSWMKFYSTPTPAPDWYREYPGFNNGI